MYFICAAPKQTCSFLEAKSIKIGGTKCNTAIRPMYHANTEADENVHLIGLPVVQQSQNCIFSAQKPGAVRYTIYPQKHTDQALFIRSSYLTQTFKI